MQHSSDQLQEILVCLREQLHQSRAGDEGGREGGGGIFWMKNRSGFTLHHSVLYQTLSVMKRVNQKGREYTRGSEALLML